MTTAPDLPALPARLAQLWRDRDRDQAWLGWLGLALLLSGVLHVGVQLWLGGPLTGPVSWRKPITFGISGGLTTLSLAWESIFSASGLLVMPLWILMILAPHWSVTKLVMRSPLVVLPAALLYAGLVGPRLLELFPALARPELGPIAALLGTSEGATIAWIHFLAFDLFVGRWVYLDARERGLSAWLVSPVLALVLMVGPLGLAAYFGLRALAPRSPTQDHSRTAS